MSEWTWPICINCWNKINKTRKPVPLINSEKETCCECGEKTQSGIYIRKNPDEVKYKNFT